MDIKEKLDWLLPKFCRIPLLFTVILNFGVYWGSRAIAGNGLLDGSYLFWMLYILDRKLYI